MLSFRRSRSAPTVAPTPTSAPTSTSVRSGSFTFLLLAFLLFLVAMSRFVFYFNNKMNIC
jgi:hypothetical protein